jgi:short-subunit dehydrogenase
MAVLSPLSAWPPMLFEQVLRVLADTAVLIGMLIGVVVRLGKAALFIGRSAPHKRYKSILITGSSSGIGAGLAEAFAAPGVRLFLVARSEGALEDVAARCRAKGADAIVAPADVTDESAMRAAIERADDLEPLDLVVANAGVVSDRDGLSGSRRVFDVNLGGVLNTVLPAIERMRVRRAGQVVLTSSLGGIAPPTNLYMAPYLASKAALNSYGAGLRAGLKAEGIGVQVVLSGFVESGMTRALREQRTALYGMWSTERACAHMKAHIEANTPVVRFPFYLYFVTWIMGSWQPALVDMLIDDVRKGDPMAHLDQVYAPPPPRASSLARAAKSPARTARTSSKRRQ